MVFVVENDVNVNDTLEEMRRFGDFASKACEKLPKLRLAKTCDVCNYKPKSQNGTPFSACNKNNKSMFQLCGRLELGGNRNVRHIRCQRLCGKGNNTKVSVMNEWLDGLNIAYAMYF